ncbi:endonuclease/exonuclease/phosphatase family protein [Bacteroides fragilis]|uniref:endonuclease/exonuclease/phosphatase family protein n=1 Tax=Bacteroides fragilis TaxID=817 RepID=UPI00187A80D6|nr:endonuclease/exonuclease/phosphatase family protein [Bacteroides fragilis]MBE7400127.1 endonuclease/exonuclease/phosphatase family protein [Bacteroides fragilis]
MTLFLLVTMVGQSKGEFTVLQWNVWQEGTMVPGGYDAIVNEIVRLQPDFVTFSEVRNYHNTRFNDRIVASLKEKGLDYYSFYTYDTGLLSKHPITDSLTVFPENGDHGSIYRLTSSVDGHKVAVYTSHLDYLDCAYYNVRGYDGSSWKEIPIPTTVEEVLKVNVTSQRDDAIKMFIAQAKKDIANGYNVIIGGDFNEPSHLDWIEENKNLYDHNGLVIPWTVTTLLEKDGFIDTYRHIYPNPLTHPGFTYPADNPLKEPGKLTWAPKADERDRIDFIFYQGKDIEAKKAVIFGPKGSIVRNQRVEETSKDKFLLPLDVWPTDHKGLLVTFKMK